MSTMTKFDQQVEALQQWFDSPRFARVLRLYSARQVAAQRGGIAVYRRWRRVERPGVRAGCLGAAHRRGGQHQRLQSSGELITP